MMASVCAAADRNAKVRDLLQAQGLLEILEEQLASGKEQGREQASQMLGSILKRLDPPQEFQKRFKVAADKFIAEIEPPFTADDVVEQFAKSYAPVFSDSELDQLLTYYKSPLGQKDVAATKKALPIVSAYFAERYQPIQQRAVQNYIAELERIVKECKCTK
jgi:hypothetical protein